MRLSYMLSYKKHNVKHVMLIILFELCDVRLQLDNEMT